LLLSMWGVCTMREQHILIHVGHLLFIVFALC
jgi:hypothetical protein